ncbi:MAG: homoserine dehydrogenase [Desulfobacterales bacterium]|jgi:homoserine dehydrogenase|nr:homoserine dehydrogenase [Desulfobacterales bacterium]
MKVINIGLLGVGTVGTGIAKIMIDNEALIVSRLGAKLNLKKAADLDVARDRGVSFGKGVLTTNPLDVVNDPEIDIVLEMIGGVTIAKDLILQAIANGKHVVTANKALIASHGNMIFNAAADKGVAIAFEPSVGGCMPIIKTLRESLVGNHILSIAGILNGTCNYILTKITSEGVSFDVALAGAQAEGFAEADPALDIEGFDTAHKLAILSSIAYGMEISFKDIYIEGISHITPMDIEFAGQYGYKIKLLAITKYADDTVEARVHPAMIPFSNPLSSVNGSLNAVTITGDAVGDMMLYGYGAGMLPTASAAVSDMVDIARSILAGSSPVIPIRSFQTDRIRKIPVRPMDELISHYYIRLTALDRPGVLSKIAGILGDHDISIKSVHQIDQKLKGGVPIFMLTHQAKEAEVQKALTKISSLDVITDKPMLIRIEEKNN